MKHPAIITVGDLLRAMNAGWVLFDIANKTYSGTRTASSVYHLERNGEKRGINQRAAVAAIRAQRIEPFGEITANGETKWRRTR